MADVAEAPMESAGSAGGMPEQASADVTNDYISKTISDAVDKIPSSKYLRETPEKKTPAPKKSAPAARSSPPQQAEATPQGDEETSEQDTGDEEGEESDDEQDAKEARTNAKWKEYRDAHRSVSKYKATIADLERKLAAASDQTPMETLRQQVERLSQEREALVHDVEIGNVEASQRWKQEVKAPLDEMWESVQAIAKRSNVDPNRICDFLVRGDDRGLDDYLQEAGPGDKIHALRMIHEWQRVDRKKAELKAQAHELSEGERAQYFAQREAQQNQIKSVRQNAAENILPKISERVLSLLPQDKRMDLKGALPHIVDFDNWKEDTKMYGGFAAIVLPDLLDGYRATRKELKEAKAELVKLRGGSLRTTGGSPSAGKKASSGDEGFDEDAEIKKPIRDFALGATKRLQAAMGIRS